MQDNKADDSLDEDLELEVLDDADEDLAEEVWDDAEEGDDDADMQATMPAKPKKKSSLAAYLVVAVVVIGGLYYFMGTGEKPKTALKETTVAESDENQIPAPLSALPEENPVQESSPVLPELANDADMPPMPAPIESTATENALVDTTAEQTPTNDENALTPMPGDQSAETSAKAPDQLAELVIEPVETAPAQPAEAITPSDLTDLPAPAPQIEALPSEETVDLNLPADQPENAQDQNNDLEILPAVVETAPAEEIPDQAMPAPSDVQDSKMSELESANTDLTEKLRDANTQIADLNETIDSLRGQITDLKAQKAAEKPKASAAPKAAPKPARTPEPAQDIYQPPKQSADLSSTWQMRSAQPGKAFLANKATGDMITVQTGETVKGFGKILSIDLKDGHWVVEGTLGRISR